MEFIKTLKIVLRKIQYDSIKLEAARFERDAQRINLENAVIEGEKLRKIPINYLMFWAEYNHSSINDSNGS